MRETGSHKFNPGEIAGKFVQGLFRSFYSVYNVVLTVFTLGFDWVWKRQLLSYAKIAEVRTVLDVASGTGLMTFLEAGKLQGGALVIGLDVSLEMLSVAARNARNLENVSFVRGVAEQLPFADKSMDRVTSCYLLKYADRRKFFNEIHRVLRSRGLAVSYDFSYPNGMERALTRFYIFAVLPLLSKILAPIHEGLAKVLAFLSDAIKESHWEADIEHIVKGSGLQLTEFKDLATGATKLLACIKRW